MYAIAKNNLFHNHRKYSTKGYHIQYQVHVQDKGWMDTVSDGQLAGTTGESKRIEAFKINIVKDLTPEMNIDAQTEGQNINSSLRVYGCIKSYCIWKYRFSDHLDMWKNSDVTNHIAKFIW